MLGVFTPSNLPISLRMQRPYGTSSMKNRHFKLRIYPPSTSTTGNLHVLYPWLVLKTLFKFHVSLTYVVYVLIILSLIGKTEQRSSNGAFFNIAILIN